MLVTKLSYDTKKKVLVELDGEVYFFLYPKEIKKFRLQEGCEIERQLVEEIYQLILYPRCKEKALTLLQYRNRTKKEMIQKLQQAGFPESVIQQSLQFLMEYHFIDDRAYVRNYIEAYRNKKSRLKLQQELAMKGIQKDLFHEIWQEQEDTDWEMEALKTLLEKRIRAKGMVTRENYAKFYAFFARKGYPSSKIRKLLEQEKEREEFENTSYS